MTDLTAPPLPETRLLFRVAVIVFAVTVLIGIFNGFHFFKLDRAIILTHVHAGTLGWITTGVIACGLWLFGGGTSTPAEERQARAIARLACVAVPLYVLAFLTGVFMLRMIFSLPVLIAILWFFAWIWRRRKSVEFNVAHLALILALVNLTIGALLGVSLQIELALKISFLPVGAFGAHPAMMVVGYLLLIGMALIEWQLKPRVRGVSKLGAAQVILPFLAGDILMISILINVIPLSGLNALFEVIAVVIFLIRFVPIVARTRWTEASPGRHLAVAAIFIVAGAILLVYLIGTLISNPKLGPTDPALRGMIISLDHMMFIGVMTNSLFAVIQRLTAGRRSVAPWADHVIFWGTNLGLTGFVVTLLAGQQSIEKFFTPFMGASILVAIVVYSMRMSNTSAGSLQAAPTASV